MTGTKISALPAAGALAGTEPVPIVQAGATKQTTTGAIAALTVPPTGANPTATAGPAAVNGVATTFMRSDGAAAVQKASNAQFGLVEGDGTTVTIVAGVASATANMRTAAIAFIIDGAGAAVTAGVKGYLQIPFSCTIQEVSLLADQSGSIEVDIWKCTYAQFDAGATHPVVGDSITAADIPTITAATKFDDTTLTGWTTAIAAGDILAFDVVALATSITRVTLTLRVLK